MVRKICNIIIFRFFLKKKINQLIKKKSDLFNFAASNAKNQKALEILNKFKQLAEYTGDPRDAELESLNKIINANRKVLIDKYAFHNDASVKVTPWNANFKIPVNQSMIFLKKLELLLK